MIRASVPKLNLDDAFEQKNEIAKAVEDELEKVFNMILYAEMLYYENQTSFTCGTRSLVDVKF